MFPLTATQDARLARLIADANPEFERVLVSPTRSSRNLNARPAALEPGQEYRVLSIRPLWAWSIIFAGKDIENRSWQSPYRGPLLIHASSHKHSKAELAEFRQMIAERSGLALESIPTDPPRSTMLGIVDLTDVVEDADSPWAEEDCYHFVLQNPRYLDPALTDIHGKLNIWKWTAS